METPQLDHDERVAIARLSALLELLPTALDRELAPRGITSFEFTLLDALAESEQGRMRLTALASRTNATLPRLSRVVTALEKKGLVARVPCAEDGRATNAVLTEHGRAEYRKAAPLYAAAVRRTILGRLGGDGIARLSELSLTILKQLDPAGRLAVTETAGHTTRQCAADPVG